MKVDKKDEYFAFQSKLIRRVCMNVITSIVVVVGLYLFIWKQRIGDLIVWILETVFDMKHEAAFWMKAHPKTRRQQMMTPTGTWCW